MALVSSSESPIAVVTSMCRPGCCWRISSSNLGRSCFRCPPWARKSGTTVTAPDALGGQAGHGRFKGRLHQFQKRQFHAHAGLLAAHPRHNPAERLRPGRIAGTVGKQEDGRSRFRVQWSVRSQTKALAPQRRKGRKGNPGHAIRRLGNLSGMAISHRRCR